MNDILARRGLLNGLGVARARKQLYPEMKTTVPCKHCNMPIFHYSGNLWYGTV